jgi:hypothetical protein
MGRKAAVSRCADERVKWLDEPKRASALKMLTRTNMIRRDEHTSQVLVTSWNAGGATRGSLARISLSLGSR